jgi:Dolichyl-phosphate-mannose-protein mannosyltransferase
LFGLVLVAALVLRILVALAFRPIMWFGGDSASYLATGLRLIPDPARVGGYGFMLWVLRPLHSFALVAAVQHLMGLAMGVLIYLLARRFGLPAWAATLATVPVLFDAYELQLEADALPDVPFAFLVVLALYLLLRPTGERRPARTTAAAFLLGVSALLWPVGLVLLGVLLAVLLIALLIRRAGLVTVLAALLAGALPVAAYSAWFSIHRHQFSLTRSDGVYLWSRTMTFADCSVIRLPAAERPLCPPPGPRIAASLYIWNANSPVLAMPSGRFSARTNHLALAFALRAIAAQPGDYAAAVGHDFALSFFWDRPIHPDAAIADRYQFADAATAWVPPTLWTPGGGTLAGDQAAYNNGHPAPTRAVQPYASWLVTYQRYVYLRGTLLGVILLAALAAMIARRRVNPAGLPWAFAVTILLVPPLVADFDLRYLVPAVPVACLAAALAFAPGAGPEVVQRRWTTSPADTATSEPEDTRTSSLPSESTPAAGPEST